jgi:predicted CXXCH cytochrome family protein
MIVDGAIKEIKTKTDCETLYGAGAWRSDTQGTCTTCHDVHNSLFVAEQREAALRKVCTDCHNKSLTVKTINHPYREGTPLAAEGAEKCVICHMPRATSSGFPMHLWRINTDANYSTFPTATAFGVGAPATKKIANTAPDGSYTNAVWVDVDYACGQCHGGSFGPDATLNDAPYLTKTELSMLAKNMHVSQPPVVSFTSSMNSNTATLTDTSTDDSIFPDNAITVQWGDGTSSTGNAGSVFSHTYAKPGKYKILYSVKDSDGVTRSKKVTLTPTYSITANISPALPSNADIILLDKKGKRIIKTGTGTSSYVFSGLKSGTYKVKVQKDGYIFDGDSVTAGAQNPISVVVNPSSQVVTFTHTP